MSNDVITIEVDGKTLQASKGQMLIEVTDANGTYIPRFCYHNKLTIAANCRMCLVEVEKAPKPLPACATPVMDGMKVHTKSELAIEAQKSVMEFLLINHPLDCPICDQGGECELQDLAMGYGRDVSRYQENKRVVMDKNIGPLVQTDMTRCIHCTRCVRFGEEIAGLRELGATGRGEDMAIGTYVEQSMVSEMSGNIIDLCPVGALTSKPFRFSARAWEMAQYNGIAPHDSIGSNIHFHVMADRVKRVVPADNESINEVWISDRDRFSYEGLYSDDRLLTPMVKQGGSWHEVDWETAFNTIKQRFDAIISAEGGEKLGALASATSTTEELYLLQKLLRGLGSNHIDHRVSQIDFSDQDAAPVYPTLGIPIADLEQLDAALIIGGYTRKDQPILNHRLRKAALKGAKVMQVNCIDYDFNYAIAAQAIVPPGQIAETLAAIVKSLLESGQPDSDDGLIDLIADVHIHAIHRQIGNNLKQAGRASVFLGNQAMAHPDLSVIRYLSGNIAKLSGANFGYLGEHANTIGAYLAGAVPHRLAAGAVANNPGYTASSMLNEPLSGYILYNLEVELDCWDAELAVEAMQQASTVVAMCPYKTPRMEQYADVLLPIAQYAENEGSLINVAGTQQGFSSVVAPPGEARPGWKALRVLGNTFALEGFDYNSVDDITKELNELLNGIEAANLDAWQLPASLPRSNGKLQRMTDIPMNSVDPLVRRAPALQQTLDVADGSVHINHKLAQDLALTKEKIVLVEQNGIELELPLIIDNRLAQRTVLIHAAHPGSYDLGPRYGDIQLKKI